MMFQLIRTLEFLVLDDWLRRDRFLFVSGSIILGVIPNNLFNLWIFVDNLASRAKHFTHLAAIFCLWVIYYGFVGVFRHSGPFRRWLIIGGVWTFIAFHGSLALLVQDVYNWTLNPFHMMGVVLGAAGLCAMHASLLIIHAPVGAINRIIGDLSRAGHTFFGDISISYWFRTYGLPRAVEMAFGIVEAATHVACFLVYDYQLKYKSLIDQVLVHKYSIIVHLVGIWAFMTSQMENFARSSNTLYERSFARFRLV